ncbi:5-methyltetrahydrofolate--homocysteine methyltransferase [Sphingomonas histidinilytica]|jgi:5-methyltetrahydrofolate--homocysteine methyltransferase|uniref:Methionine synthase n=1 Tax=Rhizorhabdus histidinilytica TaxID=439228 RepID=A0A1T5FEL2_9SPHN|nr:homocysteine S-methyltransferase family protein [Rhizorhabdus histidinilytica]MBO9375718.1 5-methyltetrahydrofolate--homocysteine methyltransferase [Rhizorhabdus histidinilytica]QEH81233.1 5-methyltetrahydrofolate--homocysteine methyltransferase [Sphingomonas sp. C8-2]SKB94546.1 5-methyltetrahydrofolate--homocysteine methyltransferase [Rhizorhabdus histidinilytica]
MTLRRSEAAAIFRDQAKQRILLTDGAFGTMIQSYRLEEADYRGSYDLSCDQKGNNDLLALTRPDVIDAITRQYLDAGSDIVSTNTFNANIISQEDYDAVRLVREINLAAARIARKAADDYAAKDGRPRFVAGAIGPTNKTLSLSPDVNDPGYRAVDFDTMRDVYQDQTAALLDGGCDFILIETIFDTLNAKAAIMAVLDEQAKRGVEVPMMISMTITDMSGRNLSGHSVEAFWHAVRHAHPLTIGLNCAFGADLLRPHVQVLSGLADALVMIYPNAGLPNDLGQYDEQPATTGGFIRDWAEQGLVNVVGGCCGSTPAHIAAMADAVAGKPARELHAHDHRTRLAGLDPMTMAA